MYQARLHPEQYSNTFSDAQVKKLHDAMMYVCNTACGPDVLGYTDNLPEDWLMKYRWGKGKKDGNKLPNGDKITFLKVGGRTSAIVPRLQKKTGAVAGDVSEDVSVADEDEEEVKLKKGGRKSKTPKGETEEDKEEAKPAANTKRGRKKVEEAVEGEEHEQEGRPAAKKQKRVVKGKGAAKIEETSIKDEDTGGRRRSGRISRG
jgi:formamidopyrimidine-DNA glycosylase